MRLAFLSRFGVRLFQGSGLHRVVMFLELLAFSGGRFVMGSVLLLHRMGFFLVELLVVRFFVMFSGPGQRFTWKHFHR